MELASAVPLIVGVVSVVLEPDAGDVIEGASGAVVSGGGGIEIIYTCVMTGPTFRTLSTPIAFKVVVSVMEIGPSYTVPVVAVGSTLLVV